MWLIPTKLKGVVCKIIMANHKRRKSRRHVKCMLCTDGRQGNSLKSGAGRHSKVIVNKKSREEQFKEGLRDLFRCED